MTSERHVSTRGAWRLARGTVVGTGASGLALSAHVAGGASKPGATLWLTLTVLTVVASVGASRWRWTTPGLLAVLLGAQLGFHLVFEAAEVYLGHGHVAATAGAHAGHVEHAVAEAAGMGPRMLVAHLLAAVVVTVVLRFGEAGLRTALDVLLLRVVRLLEAAVLAVPQTGRAPVVGSGFVVVRHEPARAHGSRGPPRVR